MIIICNLAYIRQLINLFSTFFW